jgi:putative intracellular protease/amidase
VARYLLIPKVLPTACWQSSVPRNGIRYMDRAYVDRLEHTKKISDIRVEDYDAIYLTGGHGIMFHFPESQTLQEVIAKFMRQGRSCQLCVMVRTDCST